MSHGIARSAGRGPKRKVPGRQNAEQRLPAGLAWPMESSTDRLTLSRGVY